MDSLYTVFMQQVCQECLNYLSVGPIKVYDTPPTSHIYGSSTKNMPLILCGRCVPSKSSSNLIDCVSESNLILAGNLFRCINYYEGCNELLNFNEAKEHEKICKKNGFKCTFCDYKGNGCQLVHHVRQKHPENVVNEDTIKITVKKTFSRNLIFVKENHIFQLVFSVTDTFLEFSSLPLSPVQVGSKHFKLKFFKPGTNVEFITLPIQIILESGNFPPDSSTTNAGSDTNSNQLKNYFVLDQTSLLESFPSGWCLCKIELTDNGNGKMEESDTKLPTIVETRVVKNVNESDFDVNRVLTMPRSDLIEFVHKELQFLQYCVCCKKYITTALYFCPKYHMACYECSNKKCLKCGIFCHWSTRPKLNISLPCNLKGCSSAPDIFNYMIHKRDCKMRQYKCPDGECEFGGVFVELKKHWHMNPLFESDTLDNIGENESLFWYVSKYHEMFYVFIEYQDNKLSITINQVDVVISTSYDFHISYNTSDHGDVKVKICSKEGNNLVKFIQTDILKWSTLQVLCSLK